MKNFIDLLTCEQKAALGNCYIINSNSELVPIINNGKLTIESFKLIASNEEDLMIVTAKDISYYDPEAKDFDFRVGEWMYWCREDTPDDVLVMLDEYLGKDKSDENDNNE